MLLAVDTSTRTIGIALYDGDRVLSEVCWLSQHHHTIELGPAVADMLELVDIQGSQIQALGVALGPGSFTSLRIGLAFAKGLAFSRLMKVIGIPTLDILAAAQPCDHRTLFAVLEAGRNRIAVGRYQAVDGCWRPKAGLENLTVEEFLARIETPAIVCGELAGSLRSCLLERGQDIFVESPARSVRRPAILAELAWSRWLGGKFDDPANLKPIYLHHGEPIPE